MGDEGTDLERGLTAVEAAERLAREGPNDLPRGRKRGVLAILGEILREPLILLLLIAGLLYVAFGEPRDAALLIGSVFVIVGLDLAQGTQAERALEALRRMADPEVMVQRDGVPHRIPLRDVVRGDVLLLREGDRVPA